MSVEDLYDLLPVDAPPPQDEGGGGEPPLPPIVSVPLDHAVTLATPPGEMPAATVGMHPSPMQLPPSPVEPYQYLASRGTNLNAQYLNPAFTSRLSRALQDAEAATGQRAVLRDLYRPPERQAQYYANYTQRPVTFGGRTYTPQEQGGLAAAPGQSRHQQGTAADVARGAILDYLHRNARNYGLEFLSGHAYQKDPVHIQLAGGGGRGNALMALQGGTPVAPFETPPSASPESGEAMLDQPLPAPDQEELDNLAAELRSLERPQPGVAQQFMQASTPPPSTHTVVTGADGQPQVINAEDAAADPTIGMTKGIMLSPDVQQRIQQGVIPS